MNHQTLFDELSAVTNEAIDRVEHNANEQWMKTALNVVEMLSMQLYGFTTDDVWEWMNDLYPNSTTHEPRAMGAVMRRAAQHKLCAPTDRYIKSVRTSCHQRPIRVWAGI